MDEIRYRYPQEHSESCWEGDHKNCYSSYPPRFFGERKCGCRCHKK